MFKSKKTIQHLIIILLCFGLVGSYYYFIKAAVTPVVRFTADTNVSLSGLTGNDLQIGTDSECVGISINGSTLTVDDITDGSTFNLKTPDHETALSVSPSGSVADLTVSSSDISSDDITQWTVAAAGANINYSVGTEAANTYYEVNVNGSSQGTFNSGASAGISFAYSQTGGGSRVFTVARTSAPSGGILISSSASPISPSLGFEVIIGPIATSTDGEIIKPEISIEKTDEREVVLRFIVGPDTERMVISEDPEFKDASQEAFKEVKEWTLSPGYGKKTIYVKFFTKYGVGSEIISVDVILVPKIPVVEIIPSVPTTTTTTTTIPITEPEVTLPKIIKIVTPKSIQKIIAGKYETYSGWSASIYAELAESVAIGTKKLYVAAKLFIVNVFDWTINGIYNLMPDSLIDWLFEPDSDSWLKETRESIKTPKEIIIKDSEDYYHGIAGTIYGELAEKIVQKNNKIVGWIKSELIELIRG